MREILFRGYNVESKKWYQGMLGKFDGKYYIDDGSGTKAYVDEESIGQYTGFKDCEDTKIFEGDAINWDIDLYGYVVNNRYEDTRYTKGIKR